MRSDSKVIQKVVGDALSGKSAHAATKKVFEGLDWKLASTRPAGAPHSIYDLMWHMAFWQDWVVTWLDGGKPAMPEHAAGGWPQNPAPSDEKEWDRAIKNFGKGLAGLTRRSRVGNLLTKRGKHTRLGMLQAIASHNSYHAGQVALLRQMLGAWPPPSGGVTW